MEVIETIIRKEHLPDAAIWLMIEALNKMTKQGRIKIAMAILIKEYSDKLEETAKLTDQ